MCIRDRYITYETKSLKSLSEKSRNEVIDILSKAIRDISGLGREKILVVGLGNRNITADSLGPKTLDKIKVTAQYFKAYNKDFDAVSYTHLDVYKRQDEDHYSGLNDFLNSHIKVNNIFSSNSNENYTNVQKLNAGCQMKYDDNLSMEILWPYKDLSLNLSLIHI